jgi:hypothetical protein
MRLFNWLFKKKKGNTISCPRCLGKGNVDRYDIKRLQMELKWEPGTCAYCNGVGRVGAEMIANVAVDEVYLTTDLSDRERLRLINRAPEAIMRAVSYERSLENFIEEVRSLHFTDNMSSEEIAHYYLQPEMHMEYQAFIAKKQELVSYINRIIGATS